MNLVKALLFSSFILFAFSIKASNSNDLHNKKTEKTHCFFRVDSDVETKISEIRARIDSLKTILNTKKEEAAYADKQADIQRMLLQLQEFSDQIDLVEASQLSDGDKMMELVFVEYSLDGVDVDIAKLDKKDETIVVNTVETDDNSSNANNTTNNNTEDPANTTVNTNNNKTTSSSNSPISRVNPTNGELLQLSKGHYVVVMAFGVYKNATNFLNKVKSTNNQAGIIKNESRGMFYVYTNYSSDENQAIRDRNAQASKYQGAWVFSY